VTAYAQETAKIDTRIKHLEKLAEEQARLTRTVESIKDEIAAQAKSRDNRWAFRKEVYVNLIIATTDMLTGCSALLNSIDKQATFQKDVLPFLTNFLRHAGLAQLATADPVPTLVSVAVNEIMRIDSRTAEFEQIRTLAAHLYSLRTSLLEAGRKDLWDEALNNA
jgi:3-methyladenine DNA glycosylase/8-oxoguanine DNA glycosylase